MVWVWRACLGLLIAAYAGWLVWPVLQPLTAGGSISGAIAVITAEASRLGGVIPLLWLAAALLYVAAAVMTVAGLGGAPGAYFLAFACELIQRVLLQSAPDATVTDTPQRLVAVAQSLNVSVEPGPLSLSAMLVVGLLVVMSGVWHGQKDLIWPQHWTRSPI
jgi:hypothetical protein